MKQMTSPAFGENGHDRTFRPLTQLDPIKVEGEDSRDEGGEQEPSRQPQRPEGFAAHRTAELRKPARKEACSSTRAARSVSWVKGSEATRRNFHPVKPFKACRFGGKGKAWCVLTATRVGHNVRRMIDFGPIPELLLAAAPIGAATSIIPNEHRRLCRAVFYPKRSGSPAQAASNGDPPWTYLASTYGLRRQAISSGWQAIRGTRRVPPAWPPGPVRQARRAGARTRRNRDPDRGA